MFASLEWSFFGFLAAGLSAGQMLSQEKFKVMPFAMAFWNKVACAVAMFPFIVIYGLPSNPVYYILLILQSFLWVISDVIFYRAINVVGAAAVSRVMPFGTIVSFFLWFAVDWPLARSYLAHPGFSIAVTVILAMLVFFMVQLRKCPVTCKTVKALWFVLFANIVGSVTTKYITLQADVGQGVYAYVFVEALIMMVLWGVYYFYKKPIPVQEMFGKKSVLAGFLVGMIAACAITSNLYAVYHVDNPAYVSAVRYLDAPIILLTYCLIGKPMQGRIWAGLGVVACAVCLVILKSGLWF